MESILDTILNSKRAELALLKTRASELEEAAQVQSEPRPFLACMRRHISERGLALICEFKRQSPSAGPINTDGDPAQIAQIYQAGGATALSVLTDAPYFGGSAADLQTARAAVSIPVLRKDFMLDPLQVYEARAMGADAILIIMAAVSDMSASQLCDCAGSLGMAVLVEIHNETELARALRLPSPLIGINNRNLKTFVTDLAISENLARLVPHERIVIAESGIKTTNDIVRLQKAGLHGCLIGQSLMSAEDPAELLRGLSRVGHKHN